MTVAPGAGATASPRGEIGEAAHVDATVPLRVAPRFFRRADHEVGDAIGVDPPVETARDVGEAAAVVLDAVRPVELPEQRAAASRHEVGRAAEPGKRRRLVGRADGEVGRAVLVEVADAPSAEPKFPFATGPFTV